MENNSSKENAQALVICGVELLYPMTLNQYQQKAMETKMESCDNFSYMMLNLVGEVGEFASKVAKAIRKEKVSIAAINLRNVEGGWYPNEFNYTQKTPLAECAEIERELQKEAGDILWQLAGLCDVMGWNLEDIARMNLDKLASRKQRGVIDGDGDNR